MSPAEVGVTVRSVIERANRLKEWAQFEPLLCDLRDTLSQYAAKLKPRLKDNETGLKEDKDRVPLSEEWERIHLSQLTALIAFRNRAQFISSPLNGQPSPVRAWIDTILQGSGAISQAFKVDAVGDVPPQLKKLQELVATSLKEYLDTVAGEIVAIQTHGFILQLQFPAAAPPPGGPPPALPPQQGAKQ
jgi:hypothetical protein